MEKKINISERILIILAIITILFLNLKDLLNVTGLGILYDELGYWQNAFYIAKGINWLQNIYVEDLPYYSYGYSLILVPIIKIFSNPDYMYRAAIILNAIFLVIIFALGYFIGKKINPKVNSKLLIVISFLITIYPSFLWHSSFAWSEILLAMCFWMIFLLFLKLEEKNKNIDIILLAVLSVYTYVIHQRMLGVLIASVLVFCLLKIQKKITFKQLIMFLTIVMVLFIGSIVIKQNLKSNLYSENVLDGNDYSAQIIKIKELFSFEGINKFIRNISGNIWYLGASSFLLFYVGIAQIVNLLLKRKENMIGFNSYIFLLLSVVFTILISSIYLMGEIDVSTLLAGRYTETVTLPVVLVGMLAVFNGEVLKKYKHLMVIVLLMCGFVFAILFEKTLGVVTAYDLSQATSLLFGFVVNSNSILLKIFQNILISLGIFYVVISAKIPKKEIIMCVLIGSIFLHHGISIKPVAVRWGEDVIEYLKESDETLYCYVDTVDEVLDVVHMQFALYDKDIYSIDKLEDVSNDMVVYSKNIDFSIISNYEECVIYENGVLLHKKIVPQYENELKIIQNGEINESGGYILKNLNISRGNYEIKINASAKEMNVQNNSILKIYNFEECIAEYPFENLNTQLQLDLEDDKNSISIYLENATEIEIQEVSISADYNVIKQNLVFNNKEQWVNDINKIKNNYQIFENDIMLVKDRKTELFDDINLGLSIQEEEFVWTEGQNIMVPILLNPEIEHYELVLNIKMTFNSGKQVYSFCNGEVNGIDYVDGAGKVAIDIKNTSHSDIAFIELYIPDAIYTPREIENVDDDRCLGVALSKIELNEV